MHEVSICQGIVRVLEEQAEAQGYRQVNTVWLEVGPLAGVEIEALRFSFDCVTRGTLADHAGLEIVETEASAWCMVCGENKAVRRRFDPCPTCGGHQLQVTCGDELRIKQLEVE
jgi:hydrogenase nickel incorporation protein HypA/HybF